MAAKDGALIELAYAASFVAMGDAFRRPRDQRVGGEEGVSPAEMKNECYRLARELGIRPSVEIGSLEAILHRNQVAGEIDLLSIDIDGDDYYIFDSLEHLRPRVVVCEYNPTIPPDIDLYADCGSYFGASITAISRVAESKGYSLVAITDTNGIFVLKSLTAPFHQFETRFDRIKLTKHLTYLVTSFAGDFTRCGTTPFGVGIPYVGNLNGPHQSCASMGCWPRSVGTRILRRLKTLAKQVLEKSR